MGNNQSFDISVIKLVIQKAFHAHKLIFHVKDFFNKKINVTLESKSPCLRIHVRGFSSEEASLLESV